MITTWYTTVGFGGTPTPRGPWDSLTEARMAVDRWATRRGHLAGQDINAHNVRIAAYRTRALARDGDISDGPGDHGCVGLYSLWGAES